MSRVLPLSFALVTSLAACAPATAPAAAPASPPMRETAHATAHDAAQSELAPAPFDAAQLREAMRVGRQYEMRIEKAGEPPRILRSRVVAVTPEDAQFESAIYDDAGGVVTAPASNRSTWEELKHHGEFPRAGLVVAEERITTPIGSFECVVYTTTKGSGPDAEIAKFYFAKSMPGPPILFFTEKGGKRITTSTVVRFAPGG